VSFVVIFVHTTIPTSFNISLVALPVKHTCTTDFIRAADDFHICPLKQQPKIPVMAVFSGHRALSDQARYFIDCFKASFNKINNTTYNECNKS
jgi:hypothetical protein